MIEVEHLTKLYGQHAAVNDVTFKVDEGSILGFLGPKTAADQCRFQDFGKNRFRNNQKK